MVDNVVAIITARGGSKGVLRKNIRLLAGKPLITHTITAALGASRICRCIVSTEDAEIKKVSIASGAEVIDRPLELAADGSLSQDAVRHVLDTLRLDGTFPEFFVLLQPTSPLRTAGHIDTCLHSFMSERYLSAISVTEAEHHPFKCLRIRDDSLFPLFNVEDLDKPRQALPPVYRQNGAIYVAHSESFLSANSFFIPPAMPFVMTFEDSIDLDSEFDFEFAEYLIKKKE